MAVADSVTTAVAAANKATAAILDKATTAAMAADQATTATAAPPEESIGLLVRILLQVQQVLPLGALDTLTIILALLIAMAAAAAATGVSIRLARLLKVLAQPTARGSHKVPTPRLGGFGYFIPMTLFLVGVTLAPRYLYGLADGGIEPSLKTLLRLALICGSLAFVVGLMDDFIRLPAFFKLFGQIACAVLFIHLGGQVRYQVVEKTIVEGSRRSVYKKSVIQGVGFERVALTENLVLNWPASWTADDEKPEVKKEAAPKTPGGAAAVPDKPDKADSEAKKGSLLQRIPPLPIVATVLWIIILMNAYNFMDGIDGLVGAFALAMGLAMIAVYMPEANQPGLPGLAAHICIIMILGALIVGTSLGFLFYNWPPARTFLGDCGSQYVGFMLAIILVQVTRVAGETPTTLGNRALPITLQRRAYVDLLALLILVWPFLYDVGYTLIRRLVRRKAIWRAHHEHLYQRLIEAGWSHRRVVLFTFPFFLAHGALFFAYCWAPGATARLHWAGIALVPMILYTILVLEFGSAAAAQPCAATADAPAAPPPEETAGEDQPSDHAEEKPAEPSEAEATDDDETAAPDETEPTATESPEKSDQ